MSTTLTYGLKKPESGDRGTSVFTDLEDNIDLLDDHNHDGVNSALIPSTSIAKESLGIGAWSGPNSNGLYTALLTFPSGRLPEDSIVKIQDATTKEDLSHLTKIRVVNGSNIQYEIYSNDNTLSLEALII